MNGHVACPSCWSKVQHKCHICNVPVVTRNIALEKVLESAHLPCTYANLGCREFVSYSQRQVHADTCEFGPSLCPIPGCARKASSGAHFCLSILFCPCISTTNPLTCKQKLQNNDHKHKNGGINVVEWW